MYRAATFEVVKVARNINFESNRSVKTAHSLVLLHANPIEYTGNSPSVGCFLPVMSDPQTCEEKMHCTSGHFFTYDGKT